MFCFFINKLDYLPDFWCILNYDAGWPNTALPDIDYLIGLPDIVYLSISQLGVYDRYLIF